MAKLWDKGYELDTTVDRFTVGEDYLLDKGLVRWDCVGSIAHAAMLSGIGILTPDEYARLRKRLSEIIALDARGEFAILREQEDVHTAVELDLTGHLGDIGKKLHTARSRNDQVILDLRLYMRDMLLRVADASMAMAAVLVDFAEQHREVPFVGRTHYQRAMPSSAGLWAGALAESLLDNMELLRAAYRIADQCPLGSAASFGVNLNIDRQKVSDLLGFARVQNNVLYANNSRGKVEAICLATLSQIMLDLSKLSSDVIFMSIPEIGYLILPADLCAGSSLMPQKRNPGIFEAVRGRATAVMAAHAQVCEIIRPLISGYHTDFQETKGPLMNGMAITLGALQACAVAVAKLECDRKRCIESFSKDVFATDRVLDMVVAGTPFRDAYREVARTLEQTDMEDPVANIRKKTHLGATGNLGLDLARRRIEEERRWAHDAREAWTAAIEKLVV